MQIKSYSLLNREFITAMTFAIIISFSSIALATLIFSGPMLSKYLAIGISGGLIGSIILLLNNLLFSSSKISISSQQSIFALFASIIAARICQKLIGFGVEDILSTLIASFLIMNCATGFIMCLVGKLKTEQLIRYIPYPVNSGFLAGTGLLIISFGLMEITHISFSLQNIPLFFQTELLLKWLIPFLYAFLALYLMRRIECYRYLILPTMIFSAFICFYIYLFFKGISFERASNLGWTIGYYSNQSLAFPPILKITPSKIHWDMIISFIPNYFSLALLASINCSLNTSSFELISQKKLKLYDEFKITGLSNILIGLFGGIGGYQNIGVSKLNLSFGTKTRAVNVVVTLILILILFTGISILQVVPKYIVNFLLIYIGIDLTYTYLIEVKSKISWYYYLIVLAIALSVLIFNILTGVIIGLILSMFLFVLQYSKINALSKILNSSVLTSNVERSSFEMKVLAKSRRQILIPLLYGPGRIVKDLFKV